MTLRLGLLAFLTAALVVGRAAGEAPPTDANGDPLPPGVLVRLGTIRLRHAHLSQDVVFTPDGKTVISAGIPDVIRLWDAATGAPRFVLAGPPGGVYSLAVSPDGKTLAAGNSDLSITLWDLVGRRVLHTLRGHTGVARRMFFTPDGKTLLSAGADSGAGDGHLIFWDVATGRQTTRVKADEKWVLGAALSADAKTLFTTGTDGAVHVWDVAARKEVRQIPTSEKVYLSRLALSPDGKTIATSGSEGLRLWDVDKGRELRRFDPPNQGGRALVFSPDGKNLLADDSGAIGCLDLATGKHRRRLEGHCDSINNLAFSPDGKTMASVSQDQAVRLWDTATWKERLPSDAPSGAAIAAYFTPDGKHVVTAHRDQWIRVWESDTGRIVRRFGRDDYRTSGSRIMTLALSPDGKTAAAAHDGDCAICLWEVSAGKELHRFKAAKHIALSLAFTRDGRTLVSAGYGQRACLWDVTTGKEVRSIDAGADAFFNVALSGDGSLAALAGFDGVRRLFTVADGRPVGAIKKPGGRGPSTLSPDGRILAVAADGNLSLWETSSGKSFFAAPARASWDAPAQAFSPDGRLLAWGDQVNVVHVTDARSGAERGRLEGHTGPITCVSFSGDGKRLLSAGHEGTVLVWDATKLPPAHALSAKLTAHDLDEYWKDLGGDNIRHARSALESLVAAPTSSIPFLRDRVRPVQPADPGRVAKRVRDLDSDDFETREKATAELTKVGEAAEAALREALKKSPSPETRRRLSQVLDTVTGWQYPLSGEPLRAVRAVEVLERTGARDALAELARGAAGLRLTQEAVAALKRLDRLRFRGER